MTKEDTKRLEMSVQRALLKPGLSSSGHYAGFLHAFVLILVMREGKMTRLAFAVVVQLMVMIAGQAAPIQEQGVPQEETGRIHGVVVDPQGARFPGVGVTITHQASQTEYALRTNSSGEYNFTKLPSGRYNVLLQAPPKSGEFKLLKILAVEVVAGKTTTLESKMASV
jgi:hypothetical protein